MSKPSSSTSKKSTTAQSGSTKKKETSGSTKKSTQTTTKKKNTSGSASRSKSRSKAQPQVEETTSLGIEVAILICLAFSIWLFISNFGKGGDLGNIFSQFFFGLFGWVAYIFPFLACFYITYYIVQRRCKHVKRKMHSLALLYLCVVVLIHLITVGYNEGETVWGYYKYCSINQTGGGLVGGGFCKLLCVMFGEIGTYIILFAVILCTLIILTQKPILAPIKRKGEAIYHEAKVQYKRKHSPAVVFNLDGINLSAHNDEEPITVIDVSATQKTSSRRTRKPQTVTEPQVEVSTEPKKVKRTTKNTVTTPVLSNPDPNPISTQTEPQSEGLDFRIHRASQDEIFEQGLDDDLDLEMEQEVGASVPAKTSPKTRTAEMQGEETASGDQEPKTTTRTSKNPKSTDKEIKEGIEKIQQEITTNDAPKIEYVVPPVTLLNKGERTGQTDSDEHVRETAKKLQNTLHNFGVNVTITDVSCGPTVTRYELQPEQGVKVNRIVNLSDDIKLNLAAADIRIEAPIPGKAAVGIEVPNATNTTVMLRDLIDTKEFAEFPSELAFAVGKDIAGKTIVADLGKMPHLLIAGATGSGKSVCINTLILSIIYKSSPEDVKLIMIDPKVVELSVYNGIPHLFIPVVTDPKKAAGALNWAVAEMTDRYNKFAEYNVRDLKGYNQKVAKIADIDDPNKPKKLPKIVIIVDELADLMMVAPGEVQDAICRLAQLARAAGIHLIIATQRPSVNVITGTIKANMPSRIAFSVSSGVDSRTILDMNGAEKLLGKGDMLYYPQGYAKPVRLQGSFVSDKEVGDVVEFLIQNHATNGAYDKKITDMMNSSSSAAGSAGGGGDVDALFVDAGKFIIDKDKASIGMLQRVFKIGFNRAARIMDQLSDAGVVGPEEGTKPRKVLMSIEEFENYIEESL